MNDKNSFSTAFNEFQWFKLAMVFLCKKKSNSMNSHPVSVFQAIVKAVSSMTPAFTSMKNPDLPIFHIYDKKHTFKMNINDHIRVDFFFFKQPIEEISLWRWNLMEYLSKPVYSESVELLTISEIEHRNYHQLDAEFNELPCQGELCLEFLTPLPFFPDKGKSRVSISKQKFIRLFEYRFSLLFGVPVKYKPGEDDFTILPYYWRYTEIKHKAKSQPGSTQYINGTVGKLYINGSWLNFLPFLILGSELHAGSKLSNSQGYFRILHTAPAHFASAFPVSQLLISSIREVMETYDYAAQWKVEQWMYAFDEKAFADRLCLDIKNNNYLPVPNRAFLLRQKNKKDRLLEQMNPKDLIVVRCLLKIIYSVFDNIFDNDSIGSRKGLPRYRAVEMARIAVADGYEYIFQLDLEDFFPFIRLPALNRLLDYYLPQKDEFIKELLMSLAGTGYILEDQFHERVKGLALGNPLSPFLANLYLDSFDKKIKAMDIRVFRFEDELFLFCKCPADGESVLKLLATEGTEAVGDRTLKRPSGLSFGSLNCSPGRLFHYSDCCMDVIPAYQNKENGSRGSTKAVGDRTLKRPSGLSFGSLNCSPGRIYHYSDCCMDVTPAYQNKESGSRESTKEECCHNLLDSLKESLIISDPQLSLGLMGDWLIITKGMQLVEAVPMRKIRALEIRSDSMVSAGLLKKLKEKQIPVAIRLISGYVFPLLSFD